MEQKKKIYFAHPITMYNTELEEKYIKYLEDDTNGFIVVNPNSEIHEQGYKEQGMEYFKKIVQECDVLAFVGFDDGSIGAGVWKEVNYAREKNIKVYHIQQSINYISNPLNEHTEHWFNVLTVEETREKIKQIKNGYK